MIFHFILNPKSGRSPQQKKMEQEIVEACVKRQLSYRIYYTTKPRDSIDYIRNILREYPGERHRFICAGGDGTINEIANSAPGNDLCEFGVLPSGSGNDFVRNFTNKKAFSEIDAQIDGEAHAYDLIKVNDEYCVNMVNIGFDCEVVCKTVSIKKSPLVPSKLAYSPRTPLMVRLMLIPVSPSGTGNTLRLFTISLLLSRQQAADITISR